MPFLNFKVLALAVALAFAVPVPASAMTVYCTNCSNQPTQWMNNSQLVAQTAKQAQLVAGQITDYAMQVNQYITMTQNLQHAPVALIAKALGPYKDTLASLAKLYTAVNNVYTASTKAYQMLDRRREEMLNLKLTPEEYIQQEIALAQSKGGRYVEQLDRDQQAMETAQKKAEELSAMSDSISIGGGVVEGLESLMKTNKMMATELLEANTSLRMQRMAILEDEMRKAKETEYSKNALISNAQQANQASLKNRALLTDGKIDQRAADKLIANKFK